MHFRATICRPGLDLRLARLNHPVVPPFPALAQALLADLLKRGDFVDQITKEAISALGTLVATHSERVLKPREAFEALVKSLTQLLGKLEETIAAEESEGAQLAAEAVYNILAHDQARYRILSSLPSGEVATLLKNLLPLLSSQERDTLVPATRSITLMLDEDDGRRRALGALKDIALRHMVLGLSNLLRSSDPEVAYAALEASLKLLLDEEPAKRVLLVLAERVRARSPPANHLQRRMAAAAAAAVAPFSSSAPPKLRARGQDPAALQRRGASLSRSPPRRLISPNPLFLSPPLVRRSSAP